ncbi:MAG: WYL domain-containing protein [Rhodospirillales bacterium]|nr:WYL domain-containing protein [Rhodospirillales bacterium]
MGDGVRYERLKDIVELAIRMQGLRGGVTLDAIGLEYGVSRRTAERMRDAVEWAFGPLELAESDDNKHHWRLRSDALRRLVPLSAEDLAELGSAAETLERTGFGARATALRDLDTKLRASLHSDSLARIESDIEALVQAEGLAMRPGPRPQLDGDLLACLREAITTCRIVEVRYLSQSTGRWSRQRIEPYGLLYGNRAFLMGRTDWNDAIRLWRLANMCEAQVTGESFTRDPDFDLEAYARRSFGTFQEEPVDVVLRFTAEAKRDAAGFLFHASQTLEEHADGTLTVRFTAGGIDEMCWHLVTWGENVTVEHPIRLRQRLTDMCADLAGYHRSTQRKG